MSLSVVLAVCLTLGALAALVVPASPPIAPQVVDSSKIVGFVAGQPASAQEMNQTIQELVRVIDLNGTSLQQLRDEVAVLKGQVAALQPIGSVAGRKYRVAQMIMLFRKNNASSMSQRFADSLITITFNSNGTATATTDYKEREITLDLSNGNPALGIGDVVSEMENISSPYTQVGNAVTVFGQTFYVAPDGRSMIGHKGTGENGREGTILTGVEVSNN